MSNLIVVKQLPIIEEQIRAIGAEIQNKVVDAKAMVCTPETLQAVKKMRSAFNSEFKELEAQRKAAKEAVMKPYLEFEAVYNECIRDGYTSADHILGAIIVDFESQEKEKIAEEVKAFFAERADFHHIDWLKFEDTGVKVIKSASMKSLKEAVKAYVDKVNEELSFIDTSEHREEILVEYKVHRNLTRAMNTVKERHAAVAREAAAKESQAAAKEVEQEIVKQVDSFTPPVVIAPPVEETMNDPVLVLSFKVRATRSKLQKLKQFLNDGGYQYE